MVNKRVWNAVLGCDLKNNRMISVRLQGKPFNIAVIQVYAPTSNIEEAEVELLCPSSEISQWPPGSRYPMQKQESFYYQARAGAPTSTDSEAKERSPEFWVTLLI